MILTLLPSHIDVWLFSLTHQPQWALEVLNEEEIARSQRFYFARHCRRFITARGMLRFFLGQYLNQLPQSIDFYYNPHGKPAVGTQPFTPNTSSGPTSTGDKASHFSATKAFKKPGVTFNLSHSDEYAVLAVGQAYEVGVDLEHFSLRPYLELAQAYFSQKEIQRLHCVPDTMKPMLFFKIWTQKEAFIKAIGSGLSYPTQCFHADAQSVSNTQVIGANAGEVFKLIDPEDNSCWQLNSMMPMAGFCMSLCYRPEIKTIRYCMVNPEDFKTSTDFYDK